MYRKYKLYYLLLLLFGVRISLDALSKILLDFRESQILALFGTKTTKVVVKGLKLKFLQTRNLQLHVGCLLFTWTNRSVHGLRIVVRKIQDW